MIKVDTSAFVAAMKEATAKLGDALGEKGLRSTGFAGAVVFRDQAMLNALKSRKTGVLYNNIIIKRLEEEGSNTRQAYLVTVRTGKFGADGDAFYWRFVEGKPDGIGHKNVRRGKSKKDTLKKRRVEALEFGTSTTPAYPFMRPAYESKKQEAVDAMTSKISEVLKAKMSGS